jgi:hypothetical protein
LFPELQPFGVAKALADHKIAHVTVEMEYQGKIATLTFHWSQIDLQAIYRELIRVFNIPDDTMITGFVCDTPSGGLICPFRMLEGLRGMCSHNLLWSFLDTEISELTAPKYRCSWNIAFLFDLDTVSQMAKNASL